MPIIQTQRDNRVVPFWVFFNQALCLSRPGFWLSSLTTILKRLQKSSPLSPRRGRRVSSFSPRRMGCVTANLTSRSCGNLEGRAKTGVMGVMVGGSGCGVLGTVMAAGGGARLWRLLTSVRGLGT